MVWPNQSGGGLTLKSLEGKGLTVELWLPCGRAEPGVANERPKTKATATTHRPSSILAVDDDQLVLADRRRSWRILATPLSRRCQAEDARRWWSAAWALTW